MKAIIQTNYGSTDVLELAALPKPEPKDDEVLIRIHAASATPSDTAFRKGEPFLIRLMYGLQKPRNSVGGVEFAGTVEKVGKDVTRFRVGDEVFGMSPDKFGAYAEYICLPESKPLTHKSPRMSFEDAVAIIDGAATARTFLREVANVQLGQKVLINGASGAVGAYAVQIARHLGAEVTGVCSTRNVELVRDLGAHHVVDYTKEDFTSSNERYDVVFDAIGKSSFGACKRILSSAGIYMTTVPSPGIIAAILTTSFGSGKKAKFTTAGLKQNQATLNQLTELFEIGAIRPVIDRTYSLEDLPEAHRYVDTGRKRGNVVIVMVDQNSEHAAHTTAHTVATL